MAVSVPAQYQQWVSTAARATGVPAAVVAAQISQESGFNPRATSPTGAQGIAQFEPGTWRSQGVPGSPYDPNAALKGYVKLMGSLLHQYGGNVRSALAAYNAGPGNLPAGMGYANKILSNAGGGPSVVRGVPPPSAAGSAVTPVTTQSFDQAGFNQANRGYIAGSFLKSPGANPFGGNAGLAPLFAAGKLSTAPPNAQDYVSQQTVMLQHATGQLQQLAGQKLSLHPALRTGTIAGGFLPQDATYIPGRKDQGRDGQTNPGGPIIANGDGQVVGVLSDPNGFGPSYPVIRFTSGPYAGKTIYFGHTYSSVRPGQQVRSGQVISRTGTHGVGNATVPGWFEIGFAPGGVPGGFGQPTPF